MIDNSLPDSLLQKQFVGRVGGGFEQAFAKLHSLRRIETNRLQENEDFLESGGLDTPLYVQTTTSSVHRSGLLDHRSLVEF